VSFVQIEWAKIKLQPLQLAGFPQTIFFQPVQSRIKRALLQIKITLAAGLQLFDNIVYPFNPTYYKNCPAARQLTGIVR